MTDLSKFSVDEREREYLVSFDVSGSLMLRVLADTPEEAKRKAEQIADTDDIGEEVEIDYISKGRARRAGPLYRVMRDGQPMKVSRVLEGDLPREPDENGF